MNLLPRRVSFQWPFTPLSPLLRVLAGRLDSGSGEISSSLFVFLQESSSSAQLNLGGTQPRNASIWLVQWASDPDAHVINSEENISLSLDNLHPPETACGLSLYFCAELRVSSGQTCGGEVTLKQKRFQTNQSDENLNQTGLDIRTEAVWFQWLQEGPIGPMWAENPLQRAALRPALAPLPLAAQE